MKDIIPFTLHCCISEGRFFLSQLLVGGAHLSVLQKLEYFLANNKKIITQSIANFVLAVAECHRSFYDTHTVDCKLGFRHLTISVLFEFF